MGVPEAGSGAAAYSAGMDEELLPLLISKTETQVLHAACLLAMSTDESIDVRPVLQGLLAALEEQALVYEETAP